MEELIINGGTPTHKPYTMWDDYVPQKTTGRHTDVYLLDQIEAPAEYGKLYADLLAADKGDTFTLHINNGGGYVDSGFMLVDAIEKTKATVTAKLTGTVASISTIIALTCDKVIVGPHLSWLSHNYSGGVQGKGGEMKLQMEFMTRELASSFKKIHDGFFTDEEIKNIVNDTDIWLNSEEVEARLAARKAKDYKKLEEIAAARKER